MKKSIVVLIVLAVIFGAMVLTVPSPERHRQLVKEKLHYKIDESGDGRVARWLEKKATNVVVNHLAIQNCLVFNLGYYENEYDEREYVSVGVFSQVFVFPNAYNL